MFDVYLNYLDELDKKDLKDLDTGIAKLIKTSEHISSWIGWYRNNKNEKIPIIIFETGDFKDIHIQTARLLLTYKKNINLKVDDNLERKFSGITIYGNKLNRFDFATFSGIFSSVLQSEQISENEIENLILLLEKAIGLGKTVTKEAITGIWGELLTIFLAREPEKFILAWAKNSQNIHDFTFEKFKDIEVKSTLKNERIHKISSKQIENCKKDKIFFSFMVREIDNGVTVFNLYEKILSKISKNSNFILLKKMILNKCLDRIGDAFLLSQIEFDLEFSKNSLGAFYPSELNIGSITYPVLNAIYDIEINNEILINSKSVISEMDPIF